MFFWNRKWQLGKDLKEWDKLSASVALKNQEKVKFKVKQSINKYLSLPDR